MRFLFSILVVAIILFVVWSVLLSPLFSKVGKLIGDDAKNFKKKWGEKE